MPSTKVTSAVQGDLERETVWAEGSSFMTKVTYLIDPVFRYRLGRISTNFIKTRIVRPTDLARSWTESAESICCFISALQARAWARGAAKP